MLVKGSHLSRMRAEYSISNVPWSSENGYRIAPFCLFFKYYLKVIRKLLKEERSIEELLKQSVDFV